MPDFQYDMSEFDMGDGSDLTGSLDSALRVDADKHADKLDLSRRTGKPLTSLVDIEGARIAGTLNDTDLEALNLSQHTRALVMNPETAPLVAGDVNALTKYEDALSGGSRLPGRVGNISEIRDYVTNPDVNARPPQLSKGEGASFIERVVGGGVADYRKNKNALFDAFGTTGLQEQRTNVAALAGGDYSAQHEQAIRSARLEQIAQGFQPTEAQKQFLTELDDAETFAEGAAAIATNPAQAFESIARSLVSSSPAILLGIAAGPAGAGGTFAAYAAGGFMTEYGAAVTEAMANEGVDMTDPVAVASVLKNDEVMNAAYRRAGIRASIIGVASGITGALAGRFLARADVGKVKQAFGKELSAQFVGDSSGELLAQLATDEYKPGNVLLEGLGGITTAPVEIASNYSAQVDRAIAMDAYHNSREGRTDKEQDQLDVIAMNANLPKLKQLSKDVFKKFTKDASGDSEVILDSEKVTEYILEQSNVDRSNDDVLKLLEEKVNATVGSEDISVPMDVFAADIVDSSHFDALRPHMKLSDDTDTQFRREESAAAHKAMMDSYLAVASDNADMHAEAKDVYASFLSELVDTGRMTAEAANYKSEVAAAYMTQYALDQDITVAEAYGRTGLTIKGPQTGRAADIARRGELLLGQGKIEITPETYDGDYPIADRGEWYGEANYEAEGGVLVSMSPDEFLSSVKPLDIDEDSRDNIDDLKEHMLSGRTIDPLTLYAHDVTDVRASDGRHRAIAAKELGFDSVPVVDYTLDSPDLLAQNAVADPSKNLYVQHNLTAENLEHADDVGGIAVPSLAVNRLDTGVLSGFGEVTLISDKDVLNDRKAKTFNADVYSPRYPDVERVISDKGFKSEFEGIDEVADQYGFSNVAKSDLETKKFSDIELEMGLRVGYLDSIGKLPRRKMTSDKIDPLFRKFTGQDSYSLYRDDAFKEAVKKKNAELRDKYVKVGRMTREEADALIEDEPSDKALYNKANQVARLVRGKYPDRFENRKIINARLDSLSKKAQREYSSWVKDKVKAVTTDERIPTGFNSAGTRRTYVNHDMDNVVKLMRKKLQDGEGFGYGVASIRSTVARQFKTVKQIQASRGDIINSEDFDKIKVEIDNEYEDLKSALEPFDTVFSGNITEDSLKELGTHGVGSFKEYYPDVSDEVVQQAIAFLDKLRNAPTEYFEAKLQRAVNLDEFTAAVVPSDVSKATIDILKKHKLDVVKYAPNDDASREDAVRRTTVKHDLLFQAHNNAVSTYDDIRGYYSPEQVLIRLTESSDLSTFMHEFGHFMLDMEMRKDASPYMGTINNWYLANAEAVAKEAGEGVTVDHIHAHTTEGTTGDAVVDKAVLTAKHEQFARAWEAYLMEGKAPSEELRTAFRKFAQWMVEIYKSIAGLNVKLDDNIRGVFDRLVASDEQIQIAEAKLEYEPLFKDAKAAGMSPDDWKEYREQSDAPHGKAAETTRSRIFKELMRETKRWYKVEHADIMDEETARLNDSNLYRTIASLKSDATPRKEAVEKAIKDLGKRQEVDKKHTLLVALRGMGGVPTSETMTITGETSGIKAGAGSLFRKAARGLDDLANMLEAEGFDIDTTDVDGGMEQLRGMIQDALSGGEVLTFEGQDQAAARDKYDADKEAIETDTTAGIKLDYDEVKELYEVSQTDKRTGKVRKVLPRALYGMTAKDGEGVSIEEAAFIHGFDNGDDLIQSIMKAPTVKKAAEDAADAEMKKRHGDVMNPDEMGKLVADAVVNEEQGKLILTELKALLRGTRTGTITSKAMKAIAQEQIGRLAFREIHPQRYRSAEVKAARAAGAAFAKGDKEAAAEAKSQQAVNHYLAIEATKARDDIMKMTGFTSRYRKKKVVDEIRKAEGGYWEQLAKILNRFEFRRSVSMKSVDAVNMNVAEWAARIKEDDQIDVILSDAVLDESYVTHWKNVPYSKLTGVIDTVKSIEHIARYTNKMNAGEAEMEFKELVEKVVKHIDENARNDFDSSDISRKHGAGEKVKSALRLANAQMTKVPWLATWLDGERVGLMHDLLVQPFVEAFDREQNLHKEHSKAIFEAMENMSLKDKIRMKRQVVIEEAKTDVQAGNFRWHQILMVAMNTGNEGNLRKMLLGEGWAKAEDEVSIDNPALQAVLAKMEDRDWDLVELVWKNMEALYPLLADVHRTEHGTEPAKVHGHSFTLPNGRVIKGGYFPVKYDPARSKRAADNEAKELASVDSMLNGRGSLAAQVNAAATNERTGYFAPIKLELGTMVEHFQDTIHYIAYHDAVRQVNKLISNDKVQKAISTAMSPEEMSQLKPWLNDVAKAGRGGEQLTFMDKMFEHLRMGSTFVIMGASFSTQISQVLGLSAGAAEVGSINMADALSRVTAHPKQASEFAWENSKVMRHRLKTMDRELQDAANRVATFQGLKKAQELSMAPIAYLQTYMVDLPTWHAAYSKGLDTYEGNESRAMKYADWVVEQVQGSGSVHSMAVIMRNKRGTFRQFTSFMTYFSSQWNHQRDIFTADASTIAKAGAMMMLLMVPGIADHLMRNGLPPDDDGGDWWKAMGISIALSPTVPFVFIRDMASAVATDYGYTASATIGILGRGLQGMTNMIGDLVQGETPTRASVESSARLTGATFHIPGVNQVIKVNRAIEESHDRELRLLEYGFGPQRNK